MKTLYCWIIALMTTFASSSTLFSQNESELIFPKDKFSEDALFVFRAISNSIYQHRELFTDEQLREFSEVGERFGEIEKELVQNLELGSEEYQRAYQKAYLIQAEMARVFLDEYQLIAADQWSTLVFDVNQQLVSGFYEDPSGLTCPPVVKELNLTSKQKEEFERLKREFDKDAKTRADDSRQALKSLMESHFSALKEELDANQQAVFLDWFGDLTLFEDLTISDRYSAIIRSIQNANDSRGVTQQILTTSTRTKEREFDPSLAPQKRLEIDRLLHLVLTMDDLPKQLVLSSDQVKQIATQLRSDNVVIVFPDNPPDRLKTIVENQWALPTWLDEILLQHQQVWLRQFVFQVSTMPWADSFGLMNPVVSQGLKLSLDTQEKILSLTKEYRSNVDTRVRRSKSETENAIVEMRKEMMAILTPEQRHQYRLWFGRDLTD
jgi:hypothetical protein